MRQNEIRNVRNRGVRSRLRTFVNRFEQAVAAGNLENAEAHFRAAESELDTAAKKGVIPRARASRKTGRLAERLDTLRPKA
ncbi:MAG: 30S ribosomal protein S20 [Bradymonadaceae bacterium]|nr:30S ribosomal protein S20 [Lujinxingiaceae bacterium]